LDKQDEYVFYIYGYLLALSGSLVLERRLNLSSEEKMIYKGQKFMKTEGIEGLAGKGGKSLLSFRCIILERIGPV